MPAVPINLIRALPASHRLRTWLAEQVDGA
jgi:hypothetical protein